MKIFAAKVKMSFNKLKSLKVAILKYENLGNGCMVGMMLVIGERINLFGWLELRQ